jgi:NADH-quinone oxidoreductase subunit B
MTSLRLNVLELGLACCALEYHAAAVSENLQQQWQALVSDAGDTGDTGDTGEQVGAWDVLVLAGTMTHALVPTIVSAYESLGQRRAVVSFGACSISGGPYWDSYSVASVPPVPVDVSIPGCPPTPAALLRGLRDLQQTLALRACRAAAPDSVAGHHA